MHFTESELVAVDSTLSHLKGQGLLQPDLFWLKITPKVTNANKMQILIYTHDLKNENSKHQTLFQSR